MAYRGRREKKEGSKKAVVTGIVLLLVLVVSAVVGAYWASGTDKEKPKEEVKVENRLKTTDKNIVMIMGVDEREGDVGRSDTLMIAMHDPKTEKMAILSVPRDTRVKMGRYGYDKINAAYAYGGVKLAKKTVEDLINVDIDHYVKVDVKAFERIIDAIGGVEIDVPKRMYYEDPWDDNGGLLIDLDKGRQHMDGKTAITFVRYRDSEGDIGRVRRQQQFMQAVLDKVTSPKIITSIPSIIKEVYAAVETDMSLTDILALATTIVDGKNRNLITETVPGEGMYIDEISYWVPNLKELRYTVASTLDVALTQSDRDEVEQANLEYQREIPKTAKSVDIAEFNRYDDEEKEIKRIKKIKEEVREEEDEEDEPEAKVEPEPAKPKHEPIRHERRETPKDEPEPETVQKDDTAGSASEPEPAPTPSVTPAKAKTME